MEKTTFISQLKLKILDLENVINEERKIYDKTLEAKKVTIENNESLIINLESDNRKNRDKIRSLYSEIEKLKVYTESRDCEIQWNGYDCNKYTNNIHKNIKYCLYDLSQIKQFFLNSLIKAKKDSNSKLSESLSDLKLKNENY